MSFCSIKYIIKSNNCIMCKYANGTNLLSAVENITTES